jgi:hypothetical protein
VKHARQKTPLAHGFTYSDMNDTPKAAVAKFAEHCANLILLCQIGLKSLNPSAPDIIRRRIFGQTLGRNLLDSL